MRKATLLCFGVLTGYFSIGFGEEWTNDLKGYVGFRWDDITHKGAYVGSLADQASQHVSNIYFVQTQIKDRFSYGNVFVEAMMGGAPLISAVNSASAWFAVGGGTTSQYSVELQAPYNGPYTEIPVYSLNSHSGYLWNFDVAWGVKMLPKWRVSFEPKIGYTFQSLKVKNATRSCFQGAYAGGSIAIRLWEGLTLTPNGNYLFAGWRNEKVTAYAPWVNQFDPLNTLVNGNPHGFLGSLELAWNSSDRWHVGIEWTYSHFRVDAVESTGPCPYACWTPSSVWITNQLFVNGGYLF